MGFLDKLLGRNWKTYMDKGSALQTRGENGLALQEFRVALSKFEGSEAEREELNAKIVAVSSILRGEHLARARDLQEAAQYEPARAALESALGLSTSDEEKAEIEKLRAALRRAEEGGHADPVRAAARLHGSAEQDGVDDAFSLHLAGMDSDQASHYEELGSAFKKGFVALRQGDFDAAIRHLEKAQQKHGKDAFVMAELGRAYLAKDRDEDAARQLSKADKAHDSSIYIKLLRVEALWALKRFDEAEQVLQAAHDLDPSEHKVFRAIGEHALRSGDFEPGIEAVELMLEEDPHNMGLLRMAGQLHQASGHLEQALGYFEAVLKQQWNLDPESHELVFDPVSALGAAQIYLELKKKPDRAIDLFHAMLSITDGLAAASMYSGIARAHLLKKRKKEARQALERALELLPENADEIRAQLQERMAEAS
ncbi:MAG: tetratricopeptide repeat protein [Myxococcota bacterium]|jgi:tetratricopeptide (TPR) repeat protein|nr:tetratricopeptide repeat protein [Myxococcota bacterium]